MKNEEKKRMERKRKVEMNGYDTIEEKKEKKVKEGRTIKRKE